MGPIIPLIVANCANLVRAETFALRPPRLDGPEFTAGPALRGWRGSRRAQARCLLVQACGWTSGCRWTWQTGFPRARPAI
jgi:hypothetical protein